MRLSRLILTGSAVLALSLAAGCSDDSDSPNSDPTPTDAATDPEQTGTKTRACKVDVTLTGAAQAAWTGKGRAITGNTSGPDAFFQFEKGKDSLSVYSDGEDFVSSAVVTVDGATYTTEPGADGLDVSRKGKRAAVDADAVGVDADAEGVHIVAAFTC